MNKDKAWIYKVFLLTFILSSLFSFISNSLTGNIGLIPIIIILLITIIIGILFDMIGVAILTSKVSTFHSIASQKINGGKETIYLINNSSKVSSICNDVIGDICGIVSGTLGALITIKLTNMGLNSIVSAVLVTALISSLTVGGKAICKRIAIKYADNISFFIGKLMSIISISKLKK